MIRNVAMEPRSFSVPPSPSFVEEVGDSAGETVESPQKKACVLDYQSSVPSSLYSVPRLAASSGAEPPSSVKSVQVETSLSIPNRSGKQKLGPVAEPWDKLRGEKFDVFVERKQLDHALENTAAGTIGHLRDELRRVHGNIIYP